MAQELDFAPCGWREFSFGEVATLQRGKDLPVGNRREGPYPVIGSNGIVGYHNDYVVDGPCLTVGRSGSVGKLFLHHGRAWPLNTTLWVKDFHDNDADFLYYLLHIFDFSQYATGVSVPTLNRNNVHQAQLLLPPFAEQRRIAAVLTTIQDAIAAQEDVIAAARASKRSLMQRLFTYGPGPVPAETKETEIGEIPAHWPLVPFGSVATLQRGVDLPVRDRVDGEYPVIGSNGIVGYHKDYVVNGVCLTVGRSGSVGKVFIHDGPAWPLNTSLWVKDFHNNDATFLYYMFSLFDFERYATGVSVPTLNRNFVHNAVVALPPKSEQQQIGDTLTQVDAKIAAEEDRKTALEALFKSMLHQLMTGQIRLRSDEGLPLPN